MNSKANKVFSFGFTLLFAAVQFSALVMIASSASSQAALEEIVITAERREASLQETAISISAFSDEDLKKSNIQTSEQLTGFTPGLNIQRDVIGKVVIRGVGAENFTVAGDPGVAIMTDGAYLARSSAAIFDLFDLQRVEVLRGPQGTLYGRNATGGAINFISNKPTEETSGFINVDFGNFSKARIEGAIGGTLVEDTLMGRIAVMSHQRGGFTRNVFPDVGRGLEELDDKDITGLRGHLIWNAGDDVTVNFTLENIVDESNPVPYKYTGDPLIFGGAPVPNPEGPQLRVVNQGYEFNIPGSTRSIDRASYQKLSSAQMKVDWDISDTLRFSSLTAYRETDFEWLNDGDGIQDFRVTYFQVDSSEQLTQEFQLSSNNDGPFNWVAGLYYLEEESTSFIGIPLPLGFNLPLAILIDGTSKTEAAALFGEGSYYLADNLRLTVGARFSYEEKTANYVDDRTSLGAPAPGTVNDSESWNAFTPKIGLDYFINDDVMLYGSVTQGFKSGGFNLLAIQPSYDEEEVLSVEGGIKSRFMDNRVQLNASLFHYTYDDLQVGKVVNLNAVIENAAEAKIYGGELELKALLSDNFEIDWGLSLLETEYEDFVTEDKDLPANPDGSLQEVNLSGNELPRAPGITSSLAGTYTIPLSGGDQLELWGNWQYTGDQYFIPFARPNFEQESYSVINASLTYRAADDQWSLALYGANLADEDYFTNALESGVPTPGVDRVVAQYFVGAPRTYGIRAQYNF